MKSFIYFFTLLSLTFISKTLSETYGHDDFKSVTCSHSIHGNIPLYSNDIITSSYNAVAPPSNSTLFRVYYGLGDQIYTCNSTTKLWINTAIALLFDVTDCKEDKKPKGFHSYETDPKSPQSGVVPTWTILEEGKVYGSPQVRIDSPDGATNIKEVLLKVITTDIVGIQYVVRASTYQGYYEPSAQNQTCDPNGAPVYVPYESFYYFYK